MNCYFLTLKGHTELWDRDEEGENLSDDLYLMSDDLVRWVNAESDAAIMNFIQRNNLDDLIEKPLIHSEHQRTPTDDLLDLTVAENGEFKLEKAPASWRADWTALVENAQTLLKL